MKLSPRMKKIADMIEKGDKVADIGTDHAYIPAYLVENEIAKRVIASDINEGPLENALNYLKKRNLEDQIELRLGSGLEKIRKGEVDTVIIAGMGGMLISEILEKSKATAHSIEKFILQPMVGIVELRKYLNQNGYKVVNEVIAREGEKFYQILLVAHGTEELESDIQYEISKALLKGGSENLKEFLEYKIEKLSNILKNMPESDNKDTNEKKITLEKRKKQFVEVYERCCQKTL